MIELAIGDLVVIRSFKSAKNMKDEYETFWQFASSDRRGFDVFAASKLVGIVTRAVQSYQTGRLIIPALWDLHSWEAVSLTLPPCIILRSDLEPDPEWMGRFTLEKSGTETFVFATRWR